ncbi:interleukin-15-like isoform X7 [Gouania willdenowi]|uniref:interleukin-15-like isoform X7 n=1 Tax=Gouania willdenowi TaxID=441366 RepID=UPI0010554E65|nr:interleukin-15-like isoform X7 [Gouania willdenowi]
MKILFGFTCPGDQRGSLSRPTKDALFQSTCQLCRESHKTQKSDAMLYAPSLNEVEVNCKNMSLKCYLLELIMVAEEEAVPDNRTACIFHFNETLSTEDGCPPCEAYSFENITTFLNRLNNLLEAMATRQQT